MQLKMEKLSLEAENQRDGITTVSSAYRSSKERLERIEQEIASLEGNTTTRWAVAREKSNSWKILII
jgi:predicted RNase H-like nuclease (RuvC/YqgF family)